MTPRSPAGIRMTKVGMWFILFALLVGLAATNTGNNALYMVLALMLATLVISGVASRGNLRGIRVELVPPAEVFANAPFEVRLRLQNHNRWLPRWLLLLSMEDGDSPVLVPYLGRRGGGQDTVEESMEMLVPRRGPHELGSAVVWSLFPLGLFRKGRRCSAPASVLVYPEIFSAASYELDRPTRFGEQPRRRAGWGHDLHALRGFRAGDDPRGIHWKQTARSGSLIYKQREAEESRRLSILLDNAVGPLEDEASRERFERLVSEAATAALDYLERGYEVELRTRDLEVSFGSGRRQRTAILEGLARLENLPKRRLPLSGAPFSVAELRLVLDPGDERVAAAVGSGG